VAHQEPVSAVERRTGEDGTWDAIEHRDRQTVAAICYVEQQAMTAAPGVFWGQDPHICSEADAAIAITRDQVEVGDAPVAGMARVDGKMCRAVQLCIRADGAKFSPTRERLPSLDFKGNDGHRAPPFLDDRQRCPPLDGESTDITGFPEESVSSGATSRHLWRKPLHLPANPLSPHMDDSRVECA
jgi:hypothetical protein